MAVAKWAAVAVTLLMGLANAGLVLQENAGLRVLGPALAVAAVVSVFGFVSGKPWGAGAVVAVGAANLVCAVVGAFAGLEGWPLGLVLSALGIVLGAVARPSSRRAVVA